jgi:hypothetical protein
VLCIALFGLTSPLHAQRSDRAIISGIVTDEQGAAVPGATVTITNEQTGVETVLVTNAAGAYTSPPLVLGRYAVKADIEGFKTSTASGILLEGGAVIRHDIPMQVGTLEETVEVTAATGLSVTTPDVAHTVNEKYYEDLPFITGADVRLAESVLLMQPGYLPMRPNGDPMFRGSQFNSRINGGQAMATENFFDGAAFGYASGHQQSHESTPPLEAIQEVKVITTTYSAQYGHTAAGSSSTRARPARTTTAAAGTGTSPTTRSKRTASSPSAAGSRRRRNATTTSASRLAARSSCPATTAATRRSSSRTTTTPGSARARLPASATPRRSRPSRTVISASC